jgi:hypothetical protein
MTIILNPLPGVHDRNGSKPVINLVEAYVAEPLPKWAIHDFGILARLLMELVTPTGLEPVFSP